MIKFSERLTEVRESLGMSKAEFADHVGIARSSVTRYENGETEIGLGIAEDIAEKLGINSAWLIGWSDDKYANQTTKNKTIPLVKNNPTLPLMLSDNFIRYISCDVAAEIDFAYQVKKDILFAKQTNKVKNGADMVYLYNGELQHKEIFIADKNYIIENKLISQNDITILGEVKYKFSEV